MAGDWIKLEHATADKPEVYAMADRLGIEPEHVLGCLFRVWIWADQQLRDGNARSVTEKAIDRISRVTGFGSAMVSVGWLEQETDLLVFPNFDRHNGQTAKTRALTAKRVAKCKGQKGNAEVTMPALPREEKRREEKNNTPLNPPKGKTKRFCISEIDSLSWPDALDNDEGRAILREWMEHKQASCKPYRATNGPQKLLNQFGPLGLVVFRRSVDQAIAANYQGVFPVNGANGQPSNGEDDFAEWLEQQQKQREASVDE